MRDRLLTKLATFEAKKPWLMLGIVIFITIALGYFTQFLSVTMRWSDLLPEKDPRTVQFDNIIKEFSTSSSLVVVVQGEEKQMKAFANKLAPQLEALIDSTDNEKLYQRVDYKQEIDFIRQHGLMLVKNEDLDNVKEIYYNPNLPGLFENINNSMEKEYIGREESISTREKEDGAVAFLDGLDALTGLVTEQIDTNAASDSSIAATIDNFLYGDPYIISYDKKALVMMAIPTFSITEMDKLMTGTEQAQTLVDDLLVEYPNLEAGLSGFIALGHDELVTSEQSLGYTTVIALIAIFIMLMFSFRMWMAPLMAITNLIIGIIWAVGLTALTVGQLNMMTQMMMVILLGLGIDFSIHLISTFTENRAQGESIENSLINTFLKSGKGVITGAFTTSFAFFSLIISHSRGMKEMGIVTGLGLLAILACTLLFLPTVMVLREKRLEKKQKAANKVRDLSFQFLGKSSVAMHNKWYATLIGVILVTVWLALIGSQITFDYNYMNIEAKGLRSIALQDTILKKYDLSMDYAMVTAESPRESRELADAFKDQSTVAMVDDISLYFPSQEQQDERRTNVNEIRQTISQAPLLKRLTEQDKEKLVDELVRLEMNIIEMQDMAFIGGQDKVDNKCKTIVGDPEKENPTSKIAILIDKIENDQNALQKLSILQSAFAPRYKQAVVQMANTQDIHFDMLPESILNRYCNDARDKYLVTIYPANNIWKDAQFLTDFVYDLDQVTPKTTGMPPVFKALIDVIGSDGRRAMLLTIGVILVLLWLDFRSLKAALIAFSPLLFGVVWMVGLMYLTKQQFTIMNVMGLPMILGIGIDDGVHIVHRWIAEGKKNIFTVFASTGKAIMLTSLTTMLAFGSLIFSIWRGFGQLGAALFFGVAACFLATITLLPALLKIVNKK